MSGDSVNPDPVCLFRNQTVKSSHSVLAVGLMDSVSSMSFFL